MRSKRGIFTATCILKREQPCYIPPTKWEKKLRITPLSHVVSCLNGAKALVIDCEVSHSNATPFLLEGNSMHCPVYIQ